MFVKGSQLPAAEAMSLDDEVLGIVDGQSRRIPRKAFKAPLTVPDITALRALTGMQEGQATQITATGRAGLFRWDSSDLKAECDADPQMGIYVPPTGQDGSQGAWVREFGQAVQIIPCVDVMWFGADPTGVELSQGAFEGALALSRHITGPRGVYLFNNTIVLGNRTYVRFPGSKNTTFQLTAEFPAVDMTPLFAFNPEYNNPTNNAFQIDGGHLEGFTIRGNNPVVGGLPTSETGEGGVDVTWTKDNIEITDVMFRELAHGCFVRDYSSGGIGHWGIRINGGGAYRTYHAYKIFPSLGYMHGQDLQSCIKGIDIGVPGLSSSTVWITALRAEVNTSYTVPADAFHVRTTSKCSISGYFEGSARHILLDGSGGLATTTLLNCQFSRVFQGGIPGNPGANIRYNHTSGGASLTIVGTWGAWNGNAAFMEFADDAAGTVTWVGQGGNTGQIFRTETGAASQYPPTQLHYFNPDRVRGGAQLNNMTVYGSPREWSGSPFGFYTRRYTRRVRSTVVGQHPLASFSGRCVGRVRAAMLDPSSGVDGDIMHRVIEFAWVNKGAVTLTSTDIVNIEGGNGPNIFFDGADLVLENRSTTLDVIGLQMEITSEDDPDNIIEWHALP